MYKKICNIVYVFTLMYCWCSCNSWLDVELINKTEESRLFSTETGFKEALAGVYSQISVKELYGQQMTFGAMDVLAQIYDYSNMQKSWWDYRDYNYETDAVKGTIYQFWSRSYTTIASINNILYWAEQNKQVMKKEVSDQICGEALALRAYLHFDLLRMFAPDVKLKPDVKLIPYNKKFSIEAPSVYSGTEIIGLVLEDLHAALTFLEHDPIQEVVPHEMGNAAADGDDPVNKNKNGADTYVARMNYYAVKALMARVYLANGDLKEARETAMEVINSGKFRLVQAATSIEVPESDLDILFSDEHIFSLRNKNIRTFSTDIHRKTSETGYLILPMASYYADVYDYKSEDIRCLNWIPDKALEKYTRKNEVRFFSKVPLIRLAEMYLIVIETYFEEGDKRPAIELMNEYRSNRLRRNEDRGYLGRQEITDEYRREFIGEGQLFFYYKRLNLPIRREIAPYNVPASDAVFVFPMPEREIQYGNVVIENV